MTCSMKHEKERERERESERERAKEREYVTESARERECVREFIKLCLTEKPKSSVACMSAPALYNISSTAMSPEYAACVLREREMNIEKERERRRERGSAKSWASEKG